MDLLSSFFVQQPLHILLVAAICVLAWGLLRHGQAGRSGGGNSLLVAAGAWLGYAGWEWLVFTMTPEANIRVDLLVIWPLVTILTLWSIFRTWRSRIACRRDGET